MTFEKANAKWNEIVGQRKLTSQDFELMKTYFFKMGENAGVKIVGRTLGLGKNSWDGAIDRQSGAFSPEEIERSTNGGW